MEELAVKLANLLEEYRADEGLNPKKDNVLTWVEQFSEENRQIILEEMINVFEKRFLLENEVDDFLNRLILNTKLTRSDDEFWHKVSLLEIQENGHSQRIMNEKFQELLRNQKSIDISINDDTKSHFIHLDDFLFTGNRLKNDLTKWLENAPENSKVDIIYIGYYKNGQYHAGKKLQELAESKNITLKFWRLIEMENNPHCQNVSEVLWPSDEILECDGTNDYLQTQGKYKLRDTIQVANSHCEESIFTSETNRKILEKEFTLAGLNIMSHFDDEHKKKWKPLGKTSYPGFGFGAMVFSYRNCPNNTPLAFWWGDWENNQVWYPLLQRKTYPQAVEPIIEDFEEIEF